MIENIRLSLKGIVSHKMRSVLTMLGIIIGISSIIMIVSIIQGASANLKDSIVGDSTNTIKINLYSRNDSYTYYNNSYGEIPGVNVISESSLEQIKALDSVVDVTPYYFREYDLQVCRNEKTESSAVYGVEKEYFELSDLILTSGRLFTERDYSEKHNIVLLTDELAASLFPNDTAVGKTVTISDEIFVVVGVFTRVKDYSDINNLGDYFMKVGQTTTEAYIPSSSWNSVCGYDDIQSALIKIANVDDTLIAATQTAEILNSNLTTDQYEYKSGSLSEDSEYLNQITTIASILLIGIASISLFVGGIGVMNIMLVSVTERTREIGLKKALGAKKRIILGQFLTESVVLTSVGGILGVVIGIGFSYLIGMMAELTITISIPAILIAVGFSMSVGIIFGLVPSVKASKLDPIDALRYE